MLGKIVEVFLRLPGDNELRTQVAWFIFHDDVIKWKHFPRYWPFVRGIHRSPVNIPAQRPVTWSFDVFFDLRLNKRLSKQSWGWWFETLSRPLWRHCNGGIFPVFCICFDICTLTFDIFPVHWSVWVIVVTALMSLSVWETVSMVTFSVFGSSYDVTAMAFTPHCLHLH